MRDSINHAKNFLDVFKADIENGAYKKIPATQRDKGWGGADVLITSKSKAPAKGGFYPDPQFVVTPHADEVAWLFNKL